MFSCFVDYSLRDHDVCVTLQTITVQFSALFANCKDVFLTKELTACVFAFIALIKKHYESYHKVHKVV